MHINAPQSVLSVIYPDHLQKKEGRQSQNVFSEDDKCTYAALQQTTFQAISLLQTNWWKSEVGRAEMLR